MKPGTKPLVERAFEIANECSCNKALRLRLKNEGYAGDDIRRHFIGKGLRTQLKALRLGPLSGGLQKRK
jgi:hypothetical protein